MTKKINLSFGLFAAFSSVCVLGCASSLPSSTSKSNETIGPKQIFPLQVGNTYIMKKDYYSFKTGIYYMTAFDTTRIVDTERLNNQTYYVTNKKEIVIDAPDGYRSDKGRVLEAKYPGKVGDKYYYYTKINNYTPPDTTTGTWEIIDTNDLVTVPAGTFSCYKYRLEAIGKSGKLWLRSFDWWSPGFGLIKTETYHVDSSGNMPLFGKGELVKEELK
ncbi:MAG TPA: hypothetical protein VGM92_15680 [Candidatus Kapabacteria bacterium]|jgi:hypothetical protein